MASSQIDKHRYNFLRAVKCIQEADAKFKQLARDAEDFRGAVNGLIEDWAVQCHLANRPAKEWWIFDHVASWLSTLATDPRDFGCNEENADDEEMKVFTPVSQGTRELISSYYSYTSVGGFVSLPQELPFRLYAYDPAFATREEYEALMRESFKLYFDDYVSRQPKERVPQTREMVHYTWLVRYQMLGHKWKDIAEGNAYHVSTGTVKAAVFELRNLVNLPSREKRGRPRKL